jgi:hypothetical protein
MKDKEAQRAKYREYNKSERGKARYRKYRQSAYGKEKLQEKYRQRVQLFREIQSGIGCFYCGESEPSCLRFMLRDPTKAKFLPILQNVSRSLSDWFSVIGNCEVICLNCYARRIAKYEKMIDVINAVNQEVVSQGV